MSNTTLSIPTKGLVSSFMIYGTLTISVFGFIGNLLILLITIKTKILRNRCNYLIGLLAFSDCVICIYLVHLRIFMIYDIYLIKNSLCFYTSLYGLVFLNFQAGLNLVIGLDRFIAIKYPFHYNRIDNKFYFSTVFVFILFYTIIIIGIGFYYSSNVVVTPVCMPPTAYNSYSRMIWILSNIIISIFVIVIFFFTWIALRKSLKSMATSSEKSNLQQIERVLSSLIIIIGVYSCTWVLTILALLVTQIFPSNRNLVKTIEQQLAWLVIINASTSFPIYMLRTKDYRNAFISMICFKKEENISKIVIIKHKSQIGST
ncbi:G protein-coupled receptor, rhodopsin-like family and GPCR, rhodopsin-like, 7TM domain and 7TM GPCR, olfactory receptor/chemoreceptor Srsx family-containing protein [Strongyloides ratti]|uniref:G protein-coupled receptor, rhodopsin-like family and GPCR, rhodopsin-like, 7TM domain and 7TM GPCR, olfactory receptor/chemoreceptor Srsx family-containing protein n=1 Tax=Strongyloides ratti TaxID=34506 RepID=A0A090LE17_STRRB|nr:G protein-coupled receptor, rhodopsin-like family and GPCR, rhodopsin-like, 7TM domain and 7TM GPCR, olfactory receptor/chemoreceptor Srsx family-containing protein [Strongyloides ratti]CEF66388.1 G protein-coupled receptor, rhodopsin-like family and GPCR, rhodopsin-like, 7TM domain and 7TM GPCR, olfactory receptor/chemoreceptor Srsx family-containing protein [Strongyloides ratti]